MSYPYNPYRLATGEQLDLERVNDNLEKLAGDLNRSMDLRYTYSSSFFDLAGVTESSAQALRSFRLRRPFSTVRYEVVGVELVIYSASGATWELSCTETAWPSITVATAGATTEARAVSPSRVQIPASDGLDFIVDTDDTSTITAGYLVVHFRADRGSQGDTYTRYTPTLLNAASSTAGTTLDTELNAYETAVGYNTAADSDLRIETFVARGISSAVTFRTPGGDRDLVGIHLVNVAAIGVDVALNIDGSLTATAAGAGATVIASTIADLTGLVTTGTDPMDDADDTLFQLSPSGGTSALTYVTLFWA
jgi:hypothetical protein